MELNRRRLLQATGMGMGGLFLPSLLGDRRAYAAGLPKRVVFFWTQHGPVTGRWEMTRPGLPSGDAAEWEFPFDNPDPMSFTDTLRPLHPHRKDLLILEGLSQTVSMFDSPENNHVQARSNVFNGNFKSKSTPSVDQIIGAKNLPAGGFKNLFYNNSDFGGANGPRVVDLGGARLSAGALAPTSTLSGAFNRLFGGVTGSTTPAPTGAPSPLELSRLRRGSVLDLVKRQYDIIGPRLGAEDRAKVNRHRDMIRDLENQIGQIGQQRLQCGKPTSPSGSMSTLEIARTAMATLFPVAMACDLTRTVVMEHGELATADFGAPAVAEVHADYAHSSGRLPSATMPNSTWAPGPASDGMVKYYATHAQQFADMVAAFKAVPEGNGTMLDNTALVWMSELANGWHDYHKIMVVMAGAAGGAFRPGRYLKYRSDGPDPSPVGGWGYTSTGPAHNKLLVSIMQAMGLPDNSIGQTATVGLRYKKGMPIDLTGPLPRLA